MISLALACLGLVSGPSGPFDIIYTPPGANGPCEYSKARYGLIEALAYYLANLQAFKKTQENTVASLKSFLKEEWGYFERLGVYLTQEEYDLLMERLNEIEEGGYYPKYHAEGMSELPTLRPVWRSRN